MGKSNTLGAWGEEKAVRFLKRRGFTIVDRNFRCRFGEIDIIAEIDEYLVFVEVRLRKDTRYGNPEETVDWRKQQKLKLAADYYLMTHEVEKDIRFDVVALYAHNGEKTWPLPVKHIENAF